MKSHLPLLLRREVEYPSRIEAYSRASDILKVLNPETSNDTETLGLWGALEEAEAFSPVAWMRETTDRRLESIRGFLDQSPLKNF